MLTARWDPEIVRICAAGPELEAVIVALGRIVGPWDEEVRDAQHSRDVGGTWAQSFDAPAAQALADELFALGERTAALTVLVASLAGEAWLLREAAGELTARAARLRQELPAAPTEGAM